VPAGRILAASLLAACAACASGCVRRTLDITSDPSGADVVINGHEAGTTPVRVVFQYNGTYRIELRKDGCEPVIAAARVPRRLYEIEGPDLVAEVLWPGVIVDERHLHYALQPSRSLTTAEKERLLAAGLRAADEAERLIPKLYEAPPPDPDARDRNLIPGGREKKGQKEKKGKGADKAPLPEEKPDRPDVD
jgi:hypothetical protein